MPLDRFMGADDISSNYAEILLMGPCMTDAGFEWDVPWRDPYAANRATSSAIGIRIFNPAIAREFGYHSAPNRDPGAAAWTAWAYRDLSDQEIEAIHRCTDQVRRDLLPSLPGSADLGNSLIGAAYDSAEEDARVQDAIRAWRECMEDVGIPDLPEQPMEMPSPWLAEKLDFEGPLGTASAEEIRYATIDADCRQSSTYIDTFYQVLWEKEAALVRDNADALLRIENLVAQHREKVAQIISEHAPPAPQ
jgi:hypothetical protein